MKRLLRRLTFGQKGSQARTIRGWTPGVRLLVATEALPCGCRVGFYETWSKDIVAIVDVAAEACAEGHTINRVVRTGPVDEGPGNARGRQGP